ncbi:MAG: hypothetical protein J7647_23905 [Cyanobacteria bacterium SBLK]|nr:hypothetical protein [Cyanobacteria bacterium SBLK]
MNQRDRSLPVFYLIFSVLVLMVLTLQSGCANRKDNAIIPAPAPRSSPQDRDIAKTRRIPAIVKTVEANVIESEPPQLSLAVTGNFQDGCESSLEVERKQDGNRLKIVLYRELSVDLVCPAVLVPFQEIITLEGKWTTRTHVLDVNGIILEVKI